MSKSKQPSSNYEIPLHKCQLCYQNSGRFILDCYCVVCDACYTPNDSSMCLYCEKPTRGKKLDTRDPSTFQKIGYMFNKPEVPLLRGLEIVQFQANVANKYFQYIDSRLQAYEKAVYELVRSNPRLDKYFSDRIKGFRVPPKTPHLAQPSKGDTPDPKRQDRYRSNSEPQETKNYQNNTYTRKQYAEPEIKKSPKHSEADSRADRSYNKRNRPEKPPYNAETRQPKYERDDYRKVQANYKPKRQPSSYQSQGDSSYRTSIHSSQLKPYIQNFRRN